MQDVSVTLVQTDLVWEDKIRNLSNFSRILNDLDEPTDLVVLPEMFTTGFSMNAPLLAEEMNGPAVQWLSESAASLGSVVAGSVIIREQGKYFNRLIWMRPDGSYDFYDKRHLFRMADEKKFYTPGSQRRVVGIKGWRFCPLICYDLRFPVWSRNRGDYHVLLYVANWPEPRRETWSCLLRARAIENQAYVIGLNRIGSDGNNIAYSGDSVVLDPKGTALSRIRSHEDTVETLRLSFQDLFEFRESFPAAMDADEFKLT